MVNCQGWATQGTSTPYKTCRSCHKNNKRPSGTNKTNWMGWWWNLEI